MEVNRSFNLNYSIFFSREINQLHNLLKDKQEFGKKGKDNRGGFNGNSKKLH